MTIIHIANNNNNNNRFYAVGRSLPG